MASAGLNKRRKITPHWLLMRLRRLGIDIIDSFFPRCCPVCQSRLVEGEDGICLNCYLKVPRTGYHLDPSNPLILRLVDVRTPIESAVAFFHYSKDNAYAQLIRDAKYHNQPNLDRAIAGLYAHELLAAGFFRDIDAVMPVPIHWTKRLRRGYNQSDFIALGIADVTGLPVLHNLKARRAHATQTRKSASERRRPLTGIFVVSHPERLKGKHILLVDDVITTGATILSCAQTLKKAVDDHRLSILSLGATKLT